MRAARMILGIALTVASCTGCADHISFHGTVVSVGTGRPCVDIACELYRGETQGIFSGFTYARVQGTTTDKDGHFTLTFTRDKDDDDKYDVVVLYGQTADQILHTSPNFGCQYTIDASSDNDISHTFEVDSLVRSDSASNATILSAQ